MSQVDIHPLLQVNDKIIAEEIKRVLENEGVYSLIVSDNPASSFLNTYMGTTAMDHMVIEVSVEDYNKAVKVVEKHGYQELLV